MPSALSASAALNVYGFECLQDSMWALLQNVAVLVKNPFICHIPDKVICWTLLKGWSDVCLNTSCLCATTEGPVSKQMCISAVAFCSTIANLYFPHQLEPRAPCLAALAPRIVRQHCFQPQAYPIFAGVTVDNVSLTAYAFQLHCCALLLSQALIGNKVQHPLDSPKQSQTALYSGVHRCEQLWDPGGTIYTLMACTCE